MRVTDLSLGVVIPVHSHIAANAVITDYAPKYALGAQFQWLRAAKKYTTAVLGSPLAAAEFRSMQSVFPQLLE